MRDLRRKLLSLGNHFFERLKTANFSTACGTSTLKSLPSRAFFVSDVHLRPRKHFSRCTLDCGFKTSESPALRGFVGGPRALATAALYLVLKSNGLRHSKNPPVKFSFSLKIVPATIAKKLPPQRCFKPLLIPIFNFSHKRPTFAFTSESGYTLAFAQRISHSALHAETRVHHSCCYLANLTSLTFRQRKAGESGCTPQACVRFLRHRSPAGLRNLVGILSKFAFHISRSKLSACVRREVSLSSAHSAYSRNARRPLVKTVHLPFPGGHVFIIDSGGTKYDFLSRRTPYVIETPSARPAKSTTAYLDNLMPWSENLSNVYKKTNYHYLIDANRRCISYIKLPCSL